MTNDFKFRFWHIFSAFLINSKRKAESCGDTEKEVKKEELAVVELDELYTYISKNKETGGWQGDYTRIWTAVDRNSGSLFEFEVGDGSKSTYLKMAFRIEEKYKIEHLCTDGNPSYGYYQIAKNHHITKSETCLVESWNCRLRAC